MILPVHSLPVRLAGVTLGSYWSGLSQEQPPPGVAVTMLTGGLRRQVWEPADDGRAVPRPPLVVSWSLTVARDADAETLDRAAASGLIPAVLPLRASVALPSADHDGATWSLPYDLGYTELEPDRPAVRELAPPLAWLDGVPLDVLDSGVPGAGEVVVPDSGNLVTTDAGIGGSTLVLLYLPLVQGVLTRTLDHVEHNGVLYSCTFTCY